MGKLIFLAVALCAIVASQESGAKDDIIDDAYGVWFQSKVSAKAQNLLDKIGSTAEDTNRMGRQRLNSTNRYFDELYWLTFM